jgi:hypothetical protein
VASHAGDCIQPDVVRQFTLSLLVADQKLLQGSDFGGSIGFGGGDDVDEFVLPVEQEAGELSAFGWRPRTLLGESCLYLGVDRLEAPVAVA